jgi:excisionase family DNA binding protein
MITKLLTYKEAAEMLGVHIMTAKRYVKDGVLPVVRLSAHMVRIPLDKLEELINSGGLDASKKSA